ncbi:MAG: hypothetical protein F6K62_25610 [Sphaerospermopsis sp. SIO1G2]|nr:hypothetical protein [Sphaerospermopsis sp. SIO1G2]
MKSPNVPKPAGGTTFTGTRNNNSSATITVGSINTSSDTENGGYVELTAPGNIKVSYIETFSTNGVGGDIKIDTLGTFRAIELSPDNSNSIVATSTSDTDVASINISHGAERFIVALENTFNDNPDQSGTLGQITTEAQNSSNNGNSVAPVDIGTPQEGDFDTIQIQPTQTVFVTPETIDSVQEQRDKDAQEANCKSQSQVVKTENVTQEKVALDKDKTCKQDTDKAESEQTVPSS